MANLTRTISIKSNGDFSIPPKEYARLDQNLRVPTDGGRYVQVKHWNELPNGGDNVKAYPEIIDKSDGILTVDPNGRDYAYAELSDSWEWAMWYFWEWAGQKSLPKGRIESYYTRPGNTRIFANTTPGSLTYVYVDMMEAHRAFTDAGSPEAGARDVVTQRNMTARKNIEWLCRPTGGALLKVTKIVGVYYEIEALDLLKPPPAIDYIASRPWLYFWCTQWGKYIGSSRFPQIKNAYEIQGLPPAGTPSPLLSLGGTFRIKKSSCTDFLTPGQEWTPYT